jgi:hypothetical protein
VFNLFPLCMKRKFCGNTFAINSSHTAQPTLMFARTQQAKPISFMAIRPAFGRLAGRNQPVHTFREWGVGMTQYPSEFVGLVADNDMEQTLLGLLSRGPSLGIRSSLSYQIFIHPLAILDVSTMVLVFLGNSSDSSSMPSFFSITKDRDRRISRLIYSKLVASSSLPQMVGRIGRELSYLNQN